MLPMPLTLLEFSLARMLHLDLDLGMDLRNLRMYMYPGERG